ncbi:MAG: hypothetical protein AAFQ21_06115 [Pseudomonadota bacterium]
MPRVMTAAIAGAALALIAGPAAADADPEDVLGAWTFQTQPYRSGACSMSGTMHLSPAPEAGVYGCELTAVEECVGWGRSVVVQSCTARRFGNQVSVRSVIEQMLESKFDEDEHPGLGYVPDNFALTIQDPMRMYGALISAVSAPVEFRRSVEGVS